MGIIQIQDDFEGDHSDWFTTGRAGFDFDRGFAHSGRGNAWVRNTIGWNAINRWFDVDPYSDCDVSAWIRMSLGLRDGYMSVRNSQEDGGGPILNEVRLLGFNTPNSDNSEYGRVSFSFNSGDNSRILFYVGLWGNNTDEWIQIDDFVLQWSTPF